VLIHCWWTVCRFRSKGLVSAILHFLFPYPWIRLLNTQRWFVFTNRISVATCLPVRLLETPIYHNAYDIVWGYFLIFFSPFRLMWRECTALGHECFPVRYSILRVIRHYRLSVRVTESAVKYTKNKHVTSRTKTMIITKEIPNPYRSRIFITVFTRAATGSCPEPDKSGSYTTHYLRFILIISSHLRLSLKSCVYWFLKT
jgi:hypothetical protein